MGKSVDRIEAQIALHEFNRVWSAKNTRGEPNMIEAWNFVLTYEDTIRTLLEDATKQD